MHFLPPGFDYIGNVVLPGSVTSSVHVIVPEITVPDVAVNPLHPSLSQETRQHLLQKRYRRVTLLDAYITGNTYIHAGTGALCLMTSRDEPSFKGFVFEAALARWCRENPSEIGKRVFAWCTNRHYNNTKDAFYSKYTAFVRGDKTLVNRPETAILYNTTAPFDVQFYCINEQYNKPEVAFLHKTNIEAGIQVKAITGKELEQIINPILKGEYAHVLTMLKHANGKHSYEVCMDILKNQRKKGDLTDEEYSLVARHLAHPEALGISQQHVDEYSHYISSLYQGSNAAWSEEVNHAISLDVSDRLMASSGGILIPAAQPIQMPSQFGY
jgi:hypothetical protein